MNDESKRIKEVIKEIDERYMAEVDKVAKNTFHTNFGSTNYLGSERLSWSSVAAQMILEERDLVEEMLVSNIVDDSPDDDYDDDEYDNALTDDEDCNTCMCYDCSDCEDDDYIETPVDKIDKFDFKFTDVIYAATISVCNLSDGVLIKPISKKDGFVESTTYIPGLNWDFTENDYVLI